MALGAPGDGTEVTAGGSGSALAALAAATAVVSVVAVVSAAEPPAVLEGLAELKELLLAELEELLALDDTVQTMSASFEASHALACVAKKSFRSSIDGMHMADPKSPASRFAHSRTQWSV
jgi:hypothetical protein